MSIAYRISKIIKRIIYGNKIKKDQAELLKRREQMGPDSEEDYDWMRFNQEILN